MILIKNNSKDIIWQRNSGLNFWDYEISKLNNPRSPPLILIQLAIFIHVFYLKIFNLFWRLWKL